MYTKKERIAYNKERIIRKHLEELRAIKKEASEHLKTIFDTDQCGYGEIL